MRVPFAVVLVAAALVVRACAPPPLPRVGQPVDIVTPQAVDQCAAQPSLDWCVARSAPRP